MQQNDSLADGPGERPCAWEGPQDGKAAGGSFTPCEATVPTSIRESVTTSTSSTPFAGRTHSPVSGWTAISYGAPPIVTSTKFTPGVVRTYRQGDFLVSACLQMPVGQNGV